MIRHLDPILGRDRPSCRTGTDADTDKLDRPGHFDAISGAWLTWLGREEEKRMDTSIFYAGTKRTPALDMRVTHRQGMGNTNGFHDMGDWSLWIRIEIDVSNLCPVACRLSLCPGLLPVVVSVDLNSPTLAPEGWTSTTKNTYVIFVPDQHQIVFAPTLFIAEKKIFKT
jgi:hypothetical protein